MKVAIVCDFLVKFGGAQRVLLSLHKIYPDAPIYCLLYDENGTKGAFKDCNVITSNLQKLPAFIRKRPKFLLSALPKAVEQFDFSQYDIVISSSDSYSHGIITKPTTAHFCYCHTPMRYAWDWHNEYLRENNIGFGLKGLIVRSFIHNIRMWDKIAADRVDFWIANSNNVKARIKKYYQANSTVIYPPVDTSKIKLGQEQDDYYLIISRLEPYKRVSLAVSAFNKLGKKLVIIGEGTEYSELAKNHKDNVKLLGWQSDEKVYQYLAKCKAFIFPGEDDFGITPVEAMAAGKPVIAYNKGGVRETVIAGKTGLFFNEETPESLMAAVQEMETNYGDFLPENCRLQAEKFSADNFKKQIEEFVSSKLKSYKEVLSNDQKNS